MPPRKKQNNYALVIPRAKTRSSKFGVKSEPSSNAHLKQNLPEFAKTLLKPSMTIQKLPSGVSQGNTVNKMPVSNGNSMTVKLISPSPAVNGTDGGLVMKTNVNNKLYFENINGSSDLNKHSAYGPKAIVMKPQGQLVASRDLRQFINVPQKLPPTSYQNVSTGRNQVQFIKLPYVEVSKLRDIGMLGLKPLTTTQPFSYLSKMGNSNANLHKLQNLTLIKNHNFSLVQQIPRPTLSVVPLPPANASSANPCASVSQLKLPSTLEISTTKTHLQQTSYPLSNSEKWVHINSLKSALLSAGKTPGQGQQLSLVKRNNFPILQERKNGETNDLKKGNVDKPAGSSAGDDIVILSSDESEDEMHSKTGGSAAPNVKKRLLLSKLLEKPSKVLKTNDENSVPAVSLKSCLQVVAPAMSKQKQIAKRYRNVKQQNFSSFTPVRVKIETPAVSGVEAVYSNIKKSRGKPENSGNQISELDSSDPDFQKMDIDLFFMSGEFEIPSTDVMMHKSSLACNIK